MHDIKFIKENRTDFEESMKKRNLKIDVSKLIDIHNTYLDFLNKVQKFQENKNLLSKKISKNSDLSSDEINQISKEVKNLKIELENCKNESEKKVEVGNENTQAFDNSQQNDLNRPINFSEQNWMNS